MKAKKYGSLSINIGPLAVSVGMYPTQASHPQVSFNYLCPTDQTRVRQYYMCEECGELFESKELLKGYQMHADHKLRSSMVSIGSQGTDSTAYAVFTQSELKELREQSAYDMSVEIVPKEAVTPRQYRQAYDLVPDAGAEQAYTLFACALERQDSIAVGAYVNRNNEYIGAVVPDNGRLTLHVVSRPDLAYELPDMPDVELTGEHIVLLEKMLGGLATDKPSTHPSEYAARVEAAVLAKTSGQEWRQRETRQIATQLDELIQSLKAGS